MTRAERKEELRTRLAGFARQAFVASGYEGVSYRALAHLAGVTTTSFYGLWPSKAAMFAEVMGKPAPDVAAFLSRVEAQCQGLPAHLGDLSEDAGEMRRLLFGSDR